MIFAGNKNKHGFCVPVFSKDFFSKGLKIDSREEEEF
jgi:hypothetical protein